jgi:hypothetical protein
VIVYRVKQSQQHGAAILVTHIMSVMSLRHPNSIA